MKLTPDILDALPPDQQARVRAVIRKAHDDVHGKPRAKPGTGKVGRRKAANAAMSAMPGLTDLEADMLVAIRIARLPEPAREFQFDPDRRWRFDFAWPDRKVALECEGGIWTGGRHTRGAGFEADVEKYNAAAIRGWVVLRVTTGMVKSGAAIEAIRRALA